jgi:CheY-like chemotaxis protein/MinD-like ATPase involved in chromosome partitioning or flagellar assembly
MSHLTNPRVLVVDESPTIRRLLRLYLRGDEFHVIGEAEDQEGALEQVSKHRPEFVLMDAMVSGGHGCDATHQITTRFPETIVVMVSGKEDLDVAREAMSAGARDFLAKPLTQDEVLRTLRQLYETPRAVLIHGTGGASLGTGIWSFLGTNVGDGRSAILLGIAYELLTAGKRVILVDTSPLHGDLAFQLGFHEASPCLSDLLEHPSFLAEKVLRSHIQEHNSGLPLLSGASGMAAAYGMDATRLTRLVSELVEFYEYILVDFSGGIQEGLVPILDESRFVFPTAPASPHGLRDLVTLHGLLKELGYRPPKVKPFLMNIDERGAEYWLEDTDLEVATAFPAEPKTLARSLRAGQPIPRVSPRSRHARLIRSLSQELMKGGRASTPKSQSPPVKPRRPRTLLSRLLRT